MKSVIKKLLKKLAYRLPYIRKRFLERDQLRVELEKLKMWVPPGHFHSPLAPIYCPKILEKDKKEFLVSEKTFSSNFPPLFFETFHGDS